VEPLQRRGFLKVIESKSANGCISLPETMKTSLIIFLSTVMLALSLEAQTPTASPEATLAPSPVLAASPASEAPTATPERDEDIEARIERKLKQHFKVSIDGDHNHDDIPKAVIPIVAISVLALFGTPVLIVGLIMYFSFSKSRALHRTVRMMVEKGQPVPEPLLNPPPVVRQRSDVRRGVVLVMVGLGLMIFFAAVNDWEGGAWSLGIIPFLIGVGYLLVWKLEVRKEDRFSGDTQRENASPKV
jgi:hypothetical protein